MCNRYFLGPRVAGFGTYVGCSVEFQFQFQISNKWFFLISMPKYHTMSCTLSGNHPWLQSTVDGQVMLCLCNSQCSQQPCFTLPVNGSILEAWHRPQRSRNHYHARLMRHDEYITLSHAWKRCRCLLRRDNWESSGSPADYGAVTMVSGLAGTGEQMLCFSHDSFPFVTACSLFE